VLLEELLRIEEFQDILRIRRCLKLHVVLEHILSQHYERGFLESCDCRIPDGIEQQRKFTKRHTRLNSSNFFFRSDCLFPLASYDLNGNTYTPLHYYVVFITELTLGKIVRRHSMYDNQSLEFM